MLKTVAVSANRKTGPIAVTYRAGEHQTYATCPKSCALHPDGGNGAELIDAEYLAAANGDQLQERIENLRTWRGP